jgi:hypothetical protein
MSEVLEGNGAVLAGAPNGRRTFARLIEATSHEPAAPEVLFLDFDKVEVASASYLREAVVAFRDAVRSRRSNFYPVVANANQQVEEELAFLVTPTGNALMSCRLGNEGTVTGAVLIGDLDPKQRLTFTIISEHGETDAAELMRSHSAEEEVKQTAWNNRLASLALLGLVCELSQGRSKRYRPLFEER